MDSTYIRSCQEGERHLEVRVGNAEAPEEGGRQVFGAVANAGTDVVAPIRRTLDTLGRTSDTALTALTDGCSGLRAILAAVGVAAPPLQTGSVRPEGCRGPHRPGNPQGSMMECP